MKPTSRHSCCVRTKSIAKLVSRMTKSLAYIGVLVLVVGLLFTTCVGSAWSKEMLTDEQLTGIRGACTSNSGCEDAGNCPPDQYQSCPDISHQSDCEPQDWQGNYQTYEKQVTPGGDTTTTVKRKICKSCDCYPYGFIIRWCRHDDTVPPCVPFHTVDHCVKMW